MSKERKAENVAIGKRLAQIQAFYGKTNEYMAYLTGYSVHTYQCILNGDQAISVKRLSLLANDPQFAHEIVYILTGNRVNFDYSINGNYAYLETLSKNERNAYIGKLAQIVANELSK